MKLYLEWSRPIVLEDSSQSNFIYSVDLTKLPRAPGIYIFGRRWAGQFEALYVGQATNTIRGRVKVHLNSLSLMQHLKNAKAGKRVLLAGTFVSKPGQQLNKCQRLVERGFIRHFLSEGHDLVNKQGTLLRRHEVTSTGHHPKRFFPSPMYIVKTKGE